MPVKFDLNRIKRDGDAVMEDGRETDIVVLVMGPTGAGKSTFLANVLKNLDYGGPDPVVSDGFESCTRQLTAYIALLPSSGKSKAGAGQRLVLVDTPGFDDTSVSDSEILRRIGVWLASSYDSGMKVGGVIYMFPIYPNRITRNDKANLKVFQRLCGKDGLAKVLMVTTKWTLCPDEPTGAKREGQLRTNFWKEMIDGGSGISKLYDSPESAKSVLDEVLARREHVDIALAFQKELVQQYRKLPRTEAGQELKRKLKELLKEHQAASGDFQSRRQKLENIAAQLNDLKIPFSDRIKAFFGLT